MASTMTALTARTTPLKTSVNPSATSCPYSSQRLPQRNYRENTSHYLQTCFESIW